MNLGVTRTALRSAPNCVSSEVASESWQSCYLSAHGGKEEVGTEPQLWFHSKAVGAPERQLQKVLGGGALWMATWPCTSIPGQLGAYGLPCWAL